MALRAGAGGWWRRAQRCQRGTEVSLKSLRWRLASLSPGLGEGKVSEEYPTSLTGNTTFLLSAINGFFSWTKTHCWFPFPFSHPVCPLQPPAPICFSLLWLSPLLPPFVQRSLSLATLFSPCVFSTTLSLCPYSLLSSFLILMQLSFLSLSLSLWPPTSHLTHGAFPLPQKDW